MHECVSMTCFPSFRWGCSCSGQDELLLEQFPLVSILFCSFDKTCVQEYVQVHGAGEFFATVASIILEFDLFLETTDLFKVCTFVHLVTSADASCEVCILLSPSQASLVDCCGAAGMLEMTGEHQVSATWGLFFHPNWNSHV